jgi:hypothetical protein
MNIEALKDAIKRELPGLLRDDPGLRAFILDLTRQEYAGRQETGDRFYELLADLQRDREEQTRKWEEQRRKDAEQSRQWQEKLAQQQAWWEEQRRKDAEQDRLWQEERAQQQARWEEQSRKWDESGKRFDRLHEEIMAQAQRHDRSIGALGSRWGLQSEAAFRNALAGILEKDFGVQVLSVTEYDDAGEVFGRPDQVELDVIVKNGLLLICELKSSIDKAGMYIFERKARFYERRHQRQADRLLVISPMIDARARQVAKRLGIETYGDSLEVETLEGDRG